MAKPCVFYRLLVTESSTSEGKDSNKYTLVIKHSYLGHLTEVRDCHMLLPSTARIAGELYKNTWIEMAKLLKKTPVYARD